MMIQFLLPLLLIISCKAQEIQSLAEKPIAVSQIKPFAREFFHIPKYVYANPTQNTVLEWNDDQFKRLKTAVPNITLEKIRQKVESQPQGASAPSRTKAQIDQIAFERAECYDWIYAMNLLEQYLQDGQFDYQRFEELNRRLIRLTCTNQNIIRSMHNKWFTKEISQTEHVFYKYVDRYPDALAFFRNIDKRKEHTIPFCETPQGIRNNEDRYLRVKDNNYISVKSIKQLFEILCDTKRNLVQDPLTLKPIALDKSEIDTWAKEAAEEKEYQEGYINLDTWLSKRIYVFPHPDLIMSQLSDIFDLMRVRMHPIEKAARIWFSVVALHPCEEANKRTGKAIAIFILLANGFLPPIIDNPEEFKQIFLQNLGRGEAGVQAFIQFVARKIVQAQNKFQGQSI